MKKKKPNAPLSHFTLFKLSVEVCNKKFELTTTTEKKAHLMWLLKIVYQACKL